MTSMGRFPPSPIASLYHARLWRGVSTLSIACPSKTCFSLVTDGQYDHSVPIETVPGDVTAITKINQPIPVFLGQVINRAADMWEFPKLLDALDDRPSGSLGCGWILRP